MSMSITRTGTSKPFPSFCNSQRIGLTAVNEGIDQEVNNDHLRPSIPIAALLHRPASQTAWCKPAYHRGISGYIPSVTSIFLGASETTAIRNTDRRSRRRFAGEVSQSSRSESPQSAANAKQPPRRDTRLLLICGNL